VQNGEPAESPDADLQNKKLQLELDYASGWFQYTASQRLTTFNFFLIVVGLLLVAFAQAIDHGWSSFGVCIASLGVIVSVGFLAIDVRNEVLVNKGLAALRQLERKLEIALADRALDSKHLKSVLRESLIGRPIAWLIFGSLRRRQLQRLERFFRYRFWFRSVISTVGVISCLGLLWAAHSFPGIGSPDTVSCRSSTVLVLHRPGFDLNLVQRSERQGEQRGGNDDRGRPDDGLSGDLHVQSVGVGDYKRVQTGRHCGKQAIGGG
jgi:hypothetical protein